MTFKGNVGTINNTRKDSVKGYCEVCFYELAFTKILALKNVNSQVQSNI